MCQIVQSGKGADECLRTQARPELAFVGFRIEILKTHCWIKLIGIKMLSSLCPAGCDAMWGLLMQMKH